MGVIDLFKSASPASKAQQAANAQRFADISDSLRTGAVPVTIRARLDAARSGRLPWTATLTPAELMIARSHGLKPIASVSATCWLRYGRSWTKGHAQGWETALHRLREEAKAAGANAVLDVKMRTIRLGIPASMDFTLVGTAMSVEGLPSSQDPIVATVPALEFVKLLEADVVPSGIAIGAKYGWLKNWCGTAGQTWMGNTESTMLSQLWEVVRREAHAELRRSAQGQGNGVLAHVNFSQMFEHDAGENQPYQPNQYLGRHIVIATVVDALAGVPFPREIKMVVDMHAGATPLTGTQRHHESYESNDEEVGI